MIKNASLLVLIGALLAQLLAVAEEKDAAADFRGQLIEIFDEGLRGYFVSGLMDSGLSEDDAEQTTTGFLNEVADCVINSISISAERRSTDLADVLSAMTSGGMSSLFRDYEEYQELAEPCFFDAFSKAGLQPF